MFTRIGTTATAADAVDLLLECHERIRSFLALARRIAEAAPSEGSVGDAALRVRRYFVEALPLHARDEEESVLPRLRGRAPALDAELEAMAREHREHERPLAALVAACDELVRAPERLPAVAPALAEAVGALERHFTAHLGREESAIFPAIRRLLDRSDDQAIMRELRARRSGPSRAEAAGERP